MDQNCSKIIITTSRNPSSTLLKFIKQIKNIFPSAIKLNRGNKCLKFLINFCLGENVTDLLLVYEHRGIPSSLIICHLPSGPTLFFKLFNVVINRFDKKENIPRNFPILIVQNFTSPLGKRLCSVFKSLFREPLLSTKNIVIMKAKKKLISCNYYWFERKGNFKSDIIIHEGYPNFDLFPYKISLGSLLEKNSEVEWSNNSFINTSKKKSFF